MVSTLSLGSFPVTGGIPIGETHHLGLEVEKQGSRADGRQYCSTRWTNRGWVEGCGCKFYHPNAPLSYECRNWSTDFQNKKPLNTQKINSMSRLDADPVFQKSKKDYGLKFKFKVHSDPSPFHLNHHCYQDTHCVFVTVHFP